MINDQQTSNSATSTVRCQGNLETSKAGQEQFTAKYVKRTDSYLITLRGMPFSSDLLAMAPSCPGRNPAFDPLVTWIPPDIEVPGAHAPGDRYWKSAGVAIPARTFATYRTIAIPLSLIGRNGPARNCGLGSNPQSDNQDWTCRALGDWGGNLVLHRVKQ